VQLKAAFGPEHHVHVYTSIPFNPARASDFGEAGLDEIRFHLLDGTTTKYRATIEACAEHGIEVGVELPCEPDKEEQLLALLDDLATVPVSFPQPQRTGDHGGQPREHGRPWFQLEWGHHGRCRGFCQLALRLKEAAADMPYHLKFCTAKYKDAGQLRNRFKRRGQATLRPYEVLSDDDTVLFGAIPTGLEDAAEDMAELRAELGMAEGWLRYDAAHQRIELPLSLAEDLAPVLEVPVILVEVHPTHDRLEVGLVHLNKHR
jgi:pyruvate formate-lyase activating enzyme-like uncharacterized protein